MGVWTMAIAGVGVKPLRQIIDERGRIMHMLREDDQGFERFGEIYFSAVLPGVIKGWHLHQRMVLNYAVITGLIKLVLYDARQQSETYGELTELFVGEGNYCLVTIPPGIWNGFKGVGLKEAIVANCATIPHDPEEIRRLDPLDASIPYDWGLKQR